MSLRPCCVLALLLLCGAAEAKKEWKPPKLKRLDPIAVELNTTAPLSEAAWKALKAADSCLTDDQIWEAKLQNETTPHSLLESLSFPVICWQEVEKKVGKVGADLAPAARWVGARARYVEAFHLYIASVDAVVGGEKKAVCDRLLEATRAAVTLQSAADGLATAFTTDPAKSLANWLDLESRKLGQTIAVDMNRQKCE